MAEPEIVDRRGNWILTDESCRACGRNSREIHPGGVVSGRWLCSCGQRQNDSTRHSVSVSPAIPPMEKHA